jgi:PAS domain S-box-containing protein
MQMRSVLDRDLRMVLDNAPDGVLVEAGASIAYVNDAYARLLGYRAADDLTSVTVNDIAYPDEVDRLRWFGTCRIEGKPAPTRYSFRAHASTGAIVTLDASVSVSRWQGSLLIITMVRAVPSAAPPSVQLPGTKDLSPREREVIDRLLGGSRSKEIALELNVSEKTIWTHRARAFQKLGLRGVADLFRVAAECGLIQR